MAEILKKAIGVFGLGCGTGDGAAAGKRQGRLKNSNIDQGTA
jgi:hypothetical protein